MVECSVDNAGFYSIGHIGTQYSVSHSTIDTHPITMINTAFFGIMRMNFD